MLGLSTNTEMTMSSREIAEVVNSRHDNVKTTIERLSEKGLVTFTATQEKGFGRPSMVYHVNEEHSYVVVARLSPEFTAAIVKRWKELEKNQSVPNWYKNLSPQAVVAIEDLSSQLNVATKEVDRLQGVCNTITAQFTSGLTAPAFCLQLNGVNTNQVNALMCRKGVFIKEHRGYRVTSYYRDLYFKQDIKTCRDNIESYKPVLTMKGAKWLYKLYLSHELPMKKHWDGKFDHVIFEDKAA
ncbi:Rha family transcriptional regulator [Vibrio fluvialis]|nr:Rha family transcriptional regulator [Vibrio fluvialis]